METADLNPHPVQPGSYLELNMKWNPFNTSIGLALGGGAAKGIAHIGVLKAFEEEGVEISCLSGTSIGALVAAYYAFGKSADEILMVGGAWS